MYKKIYNLHHPILADLIRKIIQYIFLKTHCYIIFYNMYFFLGLAIDISFKIYNLLFILQNYYIGEVLQKNIFNDVDGSLSIRF